MVLYNCSHSWHNLFHRTIYLFHVTICPKLIYTIYVMLNNSINNNNSNNDDNNKSDFRFCYKFMHIPFFCFFNHRYAKLVKDEEQTHDSDWWVKLFVDIQVCMFKIGHMLFRSERLIGVRFYTQILEVAQCNHLRVHGGLIGLFLVPASAPQLVITKAVVCAVLSVQWCISKKSCC